jgi:hypothetical protein
VLSRATVGYLLFFALEQLGGSLQRRKIYIYIYILILYNIVNNPDITFAKFNHNQTKNYGVHVLLVASQILLGSLLLMNHLVLKLIG